MTTVWIRQTPHQQRERVPAIIVLTQTPRVCIPDIFIFCFGGAAKIKIHLFLFVSKCSRLFQPGVLPLPRFSVMLSEVLAENATFRRRKGQGYMTTLK